MSDRFVSGGTVGPQGDEPPLSHDDSRSRQRLADTSTEWAAVQKELEDARKARAAQRTKAASGEERSLYDVLQANKAAKQAAFEEQTKIRNQFRALDDDEIEFLDEVKAAKRMEEERVRREMEEGLRAFRERQRRSSGGGGEEPSETGEDAEGTGTGTGGWGSGRKRKRGREKDRAGLVRRKTGAEDEDGTAKGGGGLAAGSARRNTRTETGTGADDDDGTVKGGAVSPHDADEKGTSTQTPPAPPALPKQKSLLVSYGSDDSDDE